MRPELRKDEPVTVEPVKVGDKLKVPYVRMARIGHEKYELVLVEVEGKVVSAKTLESSVSLSVCRQRAGREWLRFPANKKVVP